MIPSVDRFGHASHVTLKEQGDRETRQRRARAAPSPASRSPTVGDLLTDFSACTLDQGRGAPGLGRGGGGGLLQARGQSDGAPDTQPHNFRTTLLRNNGSRLGYIASVT